MVDNLKSYGGDSDEEEHSILFSTNSLKNSSQKSLQNMHESMY